MSDDLTHASFFSGVGGLDLGLERAGWRTVSFSEIEPYPSAVLAERWPGVPNLGDIVGHAERGADIPAATLWSGGFPCQDLSVAGKQRGLRAADGSLTRSGLAFAFLDLVARHRPRWLLLENVPGLLSSHGGADFGSLLDALGQLRYGWAYRVLDARFFGVPQRRRRVFIVATDADRGGGASSAAEVLAVGSRCGGHADAEREARAAAARGDSPRVAGAVPAGTHGFPSSLQEFHQGHYIAASPPPNPDGDGAAARVAGWLDGIPDVASTLRAADGHHGHSSPRGDGSDNLVVQPFAPTLNSSRAGGWRFDADQAESLVVYRKQRRAANDRVGDGIGNTLSQRDGSEAWTGHVVIGGQPAADERDPLGLDSHRYRAIGNGVASPVAEWIGQRLRAAVERPAR